MTDVSTPGLPDYAVNDPALLALAGDELKELQSERLAAMVRHVHEQAPFWRRKLDPAGITGGIDTGRLPTCTKAELLAAQEAHPPFGSYTCTPPSEWVKLFTTLGTTGGPCTESSHGATTGSSWTGTRGGRHWSIPARSSC